MDHGSETQRQHVQFGEKLNNITQPGKGCKTFFELILLNKIVFIIYEILEGFFFLIYLFKTISYHMGILLQIGTQTLKIRANI